MHTRLALAGLLLAALPLAQAQDHPPAAQHGMQAHPAGHAGHEHAGHDPAMHQAHARAALAAAVADSRRDPANVARDRYRHPQQTLEFFGVLPHHTVIEITPGGGWYTEILAPMLADHGRYIGALVDPLAVAHGRSRDYQQRTLDGFKAKLAGDSERFGKVEVLTFNPAAPVLGPAASADVVLTFRNVHNWRSAGTAQGYFDGFFRVLKPGGVLGVVDHRAKPGTALDAMKKSGYLTEALVIDLATRAGFTLVASSQVNANPKDDADHPNGVWTLPPSNRHDAADKAAYQAIGESDRMTLRFRKPR